MKKFQTSKSFLDEVKSEIVECYRDLKAETRILALQFIKARFLGEDKKIHSVKDIIKYHNENMASITGLSMLIMIRVGMPPISEWARTV